MTSLIQFIKYGNKVYCKFLSYGVRTFYYVISSYQEITLIGNLYKMYNNHNMYV